MPEGSQVAWIWDELCVDMPLAWQAFVYPGLYNRPKFGTDP